MVDFDWNWPTKIDRQAIEELFSLGFFEDGLNIILAGPNGVGKSMILKNLAHHALVQGHTVRVTSASDMLADLAAQDSGSALARRLRRFTLPKLLCVDEVGYLSYSNRYADLLFEVVSRRYEAHKAIVLSTNKAFSEWSEIFPHGASSVRSRPTWSCSWCVRRDQCIVPWASSFETGVCGLASIQFATDGGRPSSFATESSPLIIQPMPVSRGHTANHRSLDATSP
jgi:DNA replication protein DnaC